MVSSGVSNYHWKNIRREWVVTYIHHLEAKMDKWVTIGLLLIEVGGREGFLDSIGLYWGFNKQQWNTC